MSSIIPAADITASALNAERTRLDVVAQNIANMNTTQGPDGEVYRRKQVAFESVIDPLNPTTGAGVRVQKIMDDKRPLLEVHMPGHPHADENGMVKMPNINMVEEMADMLTSTRSFEANLQVLRSSKKIFEASVKIGGNG